MNPHKAFTTIPVIVFAAFTLAVALPVAAFAHVTVKPSEVMTSTYQVFTVSVPSEKAISTVAVKVIVPEGVSSITPTSKVGWTITTEKADSGETAAVKSISWTGGEIADGLRDEFTFSAKTPDEKSELQWKAHQTYSDGTVVSWDKAESGDGHSDETSGPFSVTTVMAEASGSSTDQAASDTASSADLQASADRALYVAITGVAAGLVGIFLTTRKR